MAAKRASGAAKSGGAAKRAGKGGGRVRGPAGLGADAYLGGLARREVRPVTVIYGPEEFLREEVETALRARLFPSGDPGLNLILLNGPARENEPALAPSVVLDEARSYPFLGGRKLVLVRGADRFLREAAEALLTYLKDPADCTALVLSTGALDGRTRLAQALAASDRADLVECRKLYATEFGSTRLSAGAPLGRWTLARARRLNLAPTGEALVALLERCGDSPRELARTLETLAGSLAPPAAAPDGRARAGRPIPVGIEELRRTIGLETDGNGFWFVDALVEGRTRRALEIAGAAFEEGLEGRPGERVAYREEEIALRLFSLAATELARLDAARAGLGDGLAPPAAAEAAGVPGHLREQFLTRLPDWTAERLSRALVVLGEADLGLKGFGPGARQTLETAVIRLGREAAAVKQRS